MLNIESLMAVASLILASFGLGYMFGKDMHKK